MSSNSVKMKSMACTLRHFCFVEYEDNVPIHKNIEIVKFQITFAINFLFLQDNNLE